MTALTADREPPYKQGIDLPYQLAASTTIYAGSLVMLDGGFSTRASQRGIWQGDCGSSPKAGEKQQHDSRQSKRCGGVFKRASTGVAQSNVGADAYALDDQTVGFVSTGRGKAGVIVDYTGNNIVWLD